MPTKPLRVVVQWPRLGPYHLTRLRAAHALFAARGVDLVALETASSDATYAWREETRREPFAREQVFRGTSYDALTPGEIYAGVTSALDRLAPDAVAINSYAATDAQAALSWCIRHQRAAVCLMESSMADAARSPVREWVKGQIVRAFDAALAGGTPQREYVVRLGVPNARVFEPYDVVDNDFFRMGAETVRADPDSARHLPGLSDDRPFFLASNRFVARKNLARLVEAFARFKKQSGSAWRLVLIGDGSERSALEQLVAGQAIPDVTFAGFQQIESLPAYYGRAGAFVHPALVEPWGLVINEALASRLPVLASERIGSAADLVLDGVTGFRFDPEDSDALTAALTRMAAMPDAHRLEMGQRGQELVSRWSPEHFAEGLWNAVEAGRQVTRRTAPFAGGLLFVQRVLSRRTTSFHTLRE